MSGICICPDGFIVAGAAGAAGVAGVAGFVVHVLLLPKFLIVFELMEKTKVKPTPLNNIINVAQLVHCFFNSRGLRNTYHYYH